MKTCLPYNLICKISESWERYDHYMVSDRYISLTVLLGPALKRQEDIALWNVENIPDDRQSSGSRGIAGWDIPEA